MTTLNGGTPIALITGGSRGLGRNMAESVAAHGVDVILTYRSNKEEADRVVSEIESVGRRAAALQLDAGDASTFDDFAGRIRGVLDDWGAERFNFLVNNAGVGVNAPVAETTEEQFDNVMNIHVKGTFFLTQKLLPLMADGGRVLNLSSGLARFTYPGMGAYAASKGAVEVLTRYMAKEFGERGITVNVLAPGAIETDFAGGAVRDDPENNKMVASLTALGRAGLPDDIGGVVASLLSPEMHWVTAQRIEASGGQSL